jgi:hypothetical protein
MKIEAEFLRPIDKRPLGRYNPDKTISVPIVFGPPRFSHLGNRGQFIVKVKAPREFWERWERAWEENKIVSFESVSERLSRPKKADVKELSNYAKADPEGFTSQLYGGVREALFVHPERNPKHRGGNPYGMDPQSTERVRRKSKHIYVWMNTDYDPGKRPPK